MHYELNQPHNPTISSEMPLYKGFQDVGLNAFNPTPTPLQPHSRNLFESHHLYYVFVNSQHCISFVMLILADALRGVIRGGSGGVQVGLTDFNPTFPNAHPQGVSEELVGLWGRNENSVVTTRIHPLITGKQLFL